MSGSQDLLLQLCVDSPAATVWFGRIGGGCFGPVVLSALWVVSDPPSQYKPPLGGRNKVSSSSSRHQALFVNWTFADVASKRWDAIGNSKDGEGGSTPPDYDAILDQVTLNQGETPIFGSMKTSVF